MSPEPTPSPKRPSLDATLAAAHRTYLLEYWIAQFAGGVEVDGDRVIAHASLGRHVERVAEELLPEEKLIPVMTTLAAYEAMREVVFRLEDARSRAIENLRPFLIVKALLDGVSPALELAQFNLMPATPEELRILSVALGHVIQDEASAVLLPNALVAAA